MGIGCSANRGTWEAFVEGRGVVTPYGVGIISKDKSENVNIKKVGLHYGDAYVHVKNLKPAPTVQTPYGKGSIIGTHGEVSMVLLPFGIGHFHNTNLSGAM
mmetsp:Transcript_34784/g.84151  ORF Transcript_34784/g.84151 Transcript_34784/m.84151 type:complete len:101 (+) Transcript_34784:79-381(+)|eukprot:CAMPEP_0114516836 /NCGR_PEP_ID=MMETSP0109-20121206/17552_1 /TAXON_ID=29199 /ORGANISM="Chlorarachnion reptans, Strain CCCM449" /LENGTH=100 /DNA_ID=CAMNT_0001697275 /DNA_START=27 /DNA_END=329 /DNA_ORIENTATION=-